MELLEFVQEYPYALIVAAIVAAYLYVQVRLADHETKSTPEKPKNLEGYDVEWCVGCSLWVPAKTPYCSIRGCPRPHRSM